MKDGELNGWEVRQKALRHRTREKNFENPNRLRKLRHLKHHGWPDPLRDHKHDKPRNPLHSIQDSPQPERD